MDSGAASEMVMMHQDEQPDMSLPLRRNHFSEQTKRLYWISNLSSSTGTAQASCAT